MPDYVLNRSSFEPLLRTLDEAQRHVVSMLRGLAALDSEDGDLPAFRMHGDPWTIPLVSVDDDQTISLCDAVDRLYGSIHHDIAEFFFALQSMFPSDLGFADEQIELVLGAEDISPVSPFEESYDCARAAGMDAAICAVSQAVLTSLPRGEFVLYDRMGFQIGGVGYSFNHVATLEHGAAISARRSASTRRGVNRRNFWRLKEEVFSNLLFGEDIREQVDRFAPHLFDLTLARLDDIDRRADLWWRSVDGSFPSDGCLIRPETTQTMKNYGSTRRFRGHDGQMRIFEEHIWIDRGSRLQLFRDLESRTVEIGYIGPHLPNVTSGT
jgi:hypothetical protein